MKLNLKQTLIAGSSFAGGILAGFLLNTRTDQLQSVKEKIDSTRNWLGSQGILAIGKSEKSLQKLSERIERIKNSLGSPLPDLYSATESFCLDEEDLMDA
ncbi:MAG: hypothetical protein WD604_09975 [Balneolaceae bacterium]